MYVTNRTSSVENVTKVQRHGDLSRPHMTNCFTHLVTFSEDYVLIFCVKSLSYCLSVILHICIL
jgi:hypothetical protein